MIGNIVKKYMMSRILENVPIFELRKAVEKNNPVYEKANTRKNSDLSQSFLFYPVGPVSLSLSYASNSFFQLSRSFQVIR